MTLALRPPEARRRLREIISDGVFWFTKHAREEMANDGLVETDVANVLRGGVVEEPELTNGCWRNRVRTASIEVIVQFVSEDEVVIVTAWRRSK